MAYEQKNEEQAEVYLQEGLALARQLGQLQTLERFQILFNTLYRLGELYLKQQQLHIATATFTEMLYLIPPAGSQEMFAKAQYGLARVAAAQGEIDEAHQLGEVNAATFEGVGHHRGREVRDWLKTLPVRTQV